MIIFSLGMKQRLGIAQAIMEYSDVLILDEPTNALDSEGRKLIYNIIREQKELGKIIIMTSHYEEEIIALSDEIYEFRGGSISFLSFIILSTLTSVSNFIDLCILFL